MLLIVLSMLLGDTRIGNLPPYQWPGDRGKSAQVGPSGTVAWRNGGSDANALDCPGVDNTGATYTDVAINACIAALAPSGDPTGKSIYFPRGTYKLANPIDLNHRIIMHGDGQYSTVFTPDKAVTGIIVHYACETGPCTGDRADTSVIENLGVYHPTKSLAWQPSHAYSLGDLAYGSTGPSNINYEDVFQVTTAGTSSSTEPTWGSYVEGDFITDGGVTWHAIVVAGIRLNTRATLRNVSVRNSSGNGIHIQASVPTKNANGWNIDFASIDTCNLNGLYAQGSDANAGHAYMLGSSQNRLWGVYDISFLGNTYTAASVADNGAGAYAMLGINATNQLIGCYSEGGEPPSILTGPSISIGGQHGAGFTTTSGSWRLSGGNRFETSGGEIQFKDTTAPSGAHASMPWNSNFVVNYTDDIESSSSGFTLQSGTGVGNAGWWRWRHQNLDGRNFMSWAGNAADTGPGNIWFPQGLYLGDRVFFDARSAKPTWSYAPQTAGSLRLNVSHFTQAGFNTGILGWQQWGNNSSTSQIVTLRWPHMGLANEYDLSGNTSGSPHVIDWKDEAGMLYTNVYQAAKQYVTLPASAFNPDLRFIEFSFYDANANGIRVTSTTHKFRFGSQVSAGGAYLESTTAGSWIKVKLTFDDPSGYVWVVTELTGTWTDGTNTYSSGGNFVAKTGDTMSGTLTMNADIQENNSIFMNGGSINWRGATTQNVMSLPTGETNAFAIKDVGGQSYVSYNTTAKSQNYDVVTGYSDDVYLNKGTLIFNGSHLNNVITVPSGDTDALDMIDSGGTYMMVANTTTKGFNLHGSNTNDGAGAGYIGEHLQDFVYAVSGPTGTANGSATTKTVFSHSVTAGDWMVRATLCVHDSTGSTSALHIQGAISDTTNSLGSSVRGLTQAAVSGGRSNSGDDFDPCVTIGPTRVSLASTTTEYAVIKWVQDNADVGQLYGGWEWWRVR